MSENVAAKAVGAAIRRLDKIEANQRVLKRFVMNFTTVRLGKS